MNDKFSLHQHDGKTCAQVLVYTQADLKYWIDQCNKTGHLIALDYRVEKDSMGYIDPAHDVYQIFPPEQARHFTGRGLTPLALDGGDSAASEQLSTPEVLSTLQGEE